MTSVVSKARVEFKEMDKRWLSILGSNSAVCSQSLVRVLDFVLGSGKPLKGFKQGTDVILCFSVESALEHNRQGRGEPIRQLL